MTVPGFDPAWSPDGRYIAFHRDRKKLLLTELTSERTSETPSFREQEVWLIKADGTEEPRFLAMGYMPSWSNDSKRVFFRSAVDKTVYSIPIRESARPTPIIPCEDMRPAVSPDGKYIAYARGGGRILELSTNSVIVDLGMPPIAGGHMVDWSPNGRELSLGGDGLWIYDLDAKSLSKVLHGIFGACSWSGSDAPDLAIETRGLYGLHYEIWVADLDPNLSTTESLGPGRTLEEHCREEINWATRLINISDGDLANYLWRAACHIPLREYDKAAVNFDELVALLREDPASGLSWQFNAFGIWGIDMYEAGKHEQALAMLSGINKARRAAKVDPNLMEMSYIAMSLHRLGQDREAETALNELRTRLEDEHRNDSMKWLCRAESAFAGQESDIGQVWEHIECGKLNEAYRRLKGLNQNGDISADISRATSVLARVFHERGRSGRNTSDTCRATISDYEMALRVDPNCARASSDLAWLLVTCAQVEFRNEKVAIENAAKACKSTDWKDHRYVSVLAAVYAQIGDFDKAVEWQQKALDLASGGNAAQWKAVHESRLGLYESEKSFPGRNPFGSSKGQMVGYWKFDETKGTTAKDSSGSANVGNWVGGPKWVAGREGGAIELDGKRDYVEVSSIDMMSDEATFVAWIDGWKADDWAGIVFSRSGINQSNPPCGMHFGADGRLHYTWNDNNPTTYNWTGGPTIPRNEWAMVAVVIEPSRAIAYVYSNRNGLQKGVNEIVHIPQRMEDLAIGRDVTPEYPNRFFRGKIDDVRVYDYAVTEAQIKELREERVSMKKEN